MKTVERLVTTREIDTTVVITAPIAGTVLERDVTLGELVSADAESLVVLGDTTVVWVFAHVPETRLLEARPGATVRLHVAAFPGRVIEGHVASVPPKMDETTRTAEVRVDVKDAKGLRPGMYAQAEVVMGDALGRPLEIRQGVGWVLRVRPGPDGTVEVGGRVEPVEVRELDA